MLSLRYIGTSTVREISGSDMEVAWGVSGPDISVDTRVDRKVTVSNKLGAKLLETGEFEIASVMGDGPEDMEGALPVEPVIIPSEEASAAEPKTRGSARQKSED
jgi:hypothetical protein